MTGREWTPLQLIRLRRRAPLRALAANMTFHLSQISRYERGMVQKPDPAFIEQYATALQRLGVKVSRREVRAAFKETLRQSAELKTA